MTANAFRDLFDAGDPTIGTRILTPWPGLVEVLGGTDQFDYVQFLTEYGPYDLHDLENLARAAELNDLSTMAKVDGPNRTYVAQRCLAAGIENFLFADVRSVEDAREAVRAVRPEPDGDAGLRMDRRLGYVGTYDSIRSVHEDVVQRGEDAVVALMIEKTGAVEHIKKILAVEGVDAVVFGPSDYSLSAGVPGEIDDPVVTDAQQMLMETVRETEIEPIVELTTPEGADQYLVEQDVRHFNLSTDVSILDEWWRKNGRALRERLVFG